MLGLILPLLLTAGILPASAPEAPAAGQALTRYLAGAAAVTSWSPETIEIQASLPKLKKQGRWRAVRSTNAAGDAEYRVLDSSGDRMVRQQVIERYLTAQIKAAELPASSVAITPANYQFHYQGVIQTASGTAYAFHIKPRKKRTGLIAGEIWLDGDTGTPILLSGHLVKSPSIFIRNVGITRETVLSSGIARMMLTRVSVTTRLAGPADLTVTETPLEVLHANLVP